MLTLPSRTIEHGLVTATVDSVVTALRQSPLYSCIEQRASWPVALELGYVQLKMRHNLGRGLDGRGGAGGQRHLFLCSAPRARSRKGELEHLRVARILFDPPAHFPLVL